MNRANLIKKKYCADFPHGIMFHYFHSSGDDPKDQGSLSAEDFEKILLFVGLKNILQPDEWLFRLQNNRLRTSDVCVTFDDGLRCQYDVCLPILDKYKIRCFWFVYSCVFEGISGKLDIYRILRTRCFASIDDFYTFFFKKADEQHAGIFDCALYSSYFNEEKAMLPFYTDNDIKFRFVRDKLLRRDEYESIMDRIVEDKGVPKQTISHGLWLTDAHLKELSEKGHSIGLHSYDHPTAISTLSYDEQFDQYSKNYVHIERVCSRKPIVMSHPCNSYNQDTIDVLKSLGILYGFRSDMNKRKGEEKRTNPLEIQREDSSNILRVIQRS